MGRQKKLWEIELKESLRSRESLETYGAGLDLLPEERGWFDLHEKEAPSETLPFALTTYYRSLFDGTPGDPLRRQALPRIEEDLVLPAESRDPLQEGRFSPLPGLIHRYRDRALFLASSRCALYCRHCFRRHFTGQRALGGTLCDRAGLAAEYLASKPEVRELLISGGDPLMLRDDMLGQLLEIFRQKRGDLVFRIATRMPVVLPSRVDQDLANLLNQFTPLYMITQFNHPREITEASREAVLILLSRGIPVLNQTVFLKGINDDPAVLRELFSALVQERILPYYLFQGDLAAGTSHLRGSMRKGIEIMQNFRQTLSGLATPRYAVDLPGGGGKVIVPLDPPPAKENSNYLLPGVDGHLWPYPAER